MGATPAWRCWAVACLLIAAVAARPAAAQAPDPDDRAQPNGQRAVNTVKFLAGGGAAFLMHEGGHLLFDVAFDAHATIKAVHFGPLPFFAVTPRGDLSPRREFAIAAAGFWVQEGTSEWLLTRRPSLRREHAPFAKGALAFNVLTSIGYAAVGFAKAGPPERDTRGMATALDIDERAIAAVVLAPALLDAYRYLDPEVRWSAWASRAAKAASVLLVVRGR